MPVKPKGQPRAMITAAEIRAARALLGISQAKLSDLADIGIATIKRMEAAPEIRGAAESLWKIQAALEAAGIEFIPADELKGPGVRFRHAKRVAKRRMNKP